MIGGAERIEDVVRALQVMAEATKRISVARKHMHPEVPWRQIANFRNVLVHEYEHVDLGEVWRVDEHELPALERAVRAMLADDPMDPAPGETLRGEP